MKRLSALITLLMASPAIAESYNRPTPQAQSATAEFWFAAASIALLLALLAVRWLVARR